MPAYTTYTELVDLQSSNVKVFNNYHGEYSISNCKPGDTVVYTCLGELLTTSNLEYLKRVFKNQFLLVVTTQKYPTIPESGNGYRIVKVPTAYAFYSTKIPFEKMVVDNRLFDKTF